MSPERTAAERAELLAASCDTLIWAALTMAGYRITRTPACPRPERAAARTFPASLIHVKYPVPSPESVDAWRLLAGAWDYVPRICERYGANPAVLRDALDEYVRMLLKAREPYDFRDVSRLLLRTGGLWGAS